MTQQELEARIFWILRSYMFDPDKATELIMNLFDELQTNLNYWKEKAENAHKQDGGKQQPG